MIVLDTDIVTLISYGKTEKLQKRLEADLLNACIALAHDALMVTRNVKDYKVVNGLRVENWAD